jgi:hypothetical protein
MLSHHSLSRSLLLSLSTLLTLSILAITPTQAGSNIQFVCNQTKINGKLIPVTSIRDPSKTRKMIIWEKTLGGQKPLQRCNQVTERLQQAEDKNQLNMITTGLINKQKVICTTDKYDGTCQTVLLTLEPNENKWTIFDELKDQLGMRSVGPMKNASGEPSVYYQLDIQELLRNASND